MATFLDTLGPLVDGPLGILVDEAYLVRRQPGLFFELTPNAFDRIFTLIDPALRKLPLSFVVRTFKGKNSSFGVPHHGDGSSAKMQTRHQRRSYRSPETGVTHHRGCPPDSAADVTKPRLNVIVVAVMFGNHAEPAARLKRITEAVIEVGKHVPLTKMMILH